MQATYSVTLDTTWKLVTCACGGRWRGDGGCWWRWATWLDKQLPFGHIDGLNWQNGGPGNELKGNLGEKLGRGNGGRLKIEKAAPWASVGHDGKPFALKDGGKFPKFGGGSCDISSVEKYNPLEESWSISKSKEQTLSFRSGMFRRHVHVVFWKIGQPSYHFRQLSYSFETRPKSLPGSSRFSIWRQSLFQVKAGIDFLREKPYVQATVRTLHPVYKDAE